jgi:hypothetical protein
MLMRRQPFSGLKAVMHGTNARARCMETYVKDLDEAFWIGYGGGASGEGHGVPVQFRVLTYRKPLPFVGVGKFAGVILQHHLSRPL